MPLLRNLDPRHSLVGGIIWLVIALAASFAVAASIWAGGVAREIVVQQHVRRLQLETDQLGSDMSQAINARLEAIRAFEDKGAPADVFQRLQANYPGLGWLAAADSDGAIVSSNPALHDAAALPTWVSAGRQGIWVGAIQELDTDAAAPLLGEFAAPLRDSSGRVFGVVAARLTWHWASSDVQRLSETLNPRGSAAMLVLGPAGTVVVGPAVQRNRRWDGVALEAAPPLEPAAQRRADAPRFERLTDGSVVLVARAAVSVIDGQWASASWQLLLSEPKEQVYRRANALAVRIVWISVLLGTLTALLGAFGARHLTNRLKNLAQSAAAVGRNEIARIEVPPGRDEVAQLAAAFARVLDDLRLERSELLALSSDLERRVAVRTREVERLAEESRYAAIVRERLNIARDLHDTLAHSMMAMLSEVRLLRKLQIFDPTSLPDELARAEEVAHAGLNEARSAIAQMRVSSVRDIGLGAALTKQLERFSDHTGLAVEWQADEAAAGVGDERAEVLFRMSEEILRNVERHAGASRVRVALHSPHGTDVELTIEDDGVGFDPDTAHPGHFGLTGLREQAQLIRADLQIRSAAEQGTCVRIYLRVTPENL